MKNTHIFKLLKRLISGLAIEDTDILVKPQSPARGFLCGLDIITEVFSKCFRSSHKIHKAL